VIVSRPSTNNSLPITYFSSLVWNTATNILATRVITNVGAASMQQAFSGTTYPSFSVNGITAGNYGFAASSDVPLYLVFNIATTGSSAVFSDKYVVSVNISASVVDTANPVSAALGPYGEDLIAAGWSFSAPSNSTLEFTRSLSNQSSPIYYLAANTVNPSSNLAQLRVASAATAGGTAFSVSQVYSASKYTGGTIFAINNGQLGYGSGNTTANIVFNI